MEDLFFSLTAGRAEISMHILPVGEDLQIIISGGQSHIGAVAFAGTGGVYGLLVNPGHREMDIALKAAKAIAAAAGCNVVVSAGIHIPNITREEIAEVCRLCDQLVAKAIEFLERENVRY